MHLMYVGIVGSYVIGIPVAFSILNAFMVTTPYIMIKALLQRANNNPLTKRRLFQTLCDVVCFSKVA